MQLLPRFPGAASPPLLATVVAVTLAALPHFTRMPIWIPALYVVLTTFRLSTPLPSIESADAPSWTATLFKLLVGAAVVGGVLVSYGTLTGRDAGVALLVLLAAMKLVELRGMRDFYVAGYIGLFLLLTNFFYFQSLLSAAYLVVTVIAFLSAFISFNDGRRRLGQLRRLRTASTMVAQAIPLMLVLFLLFPRIPGPLWGLPKDARAGMTGLDDEMTPGAISELTLSDEAAFRVEFDGSIPDRSLLYWRGPVLWFTDGVKWVPERFGSDSPKLTTRGRGISYTVTMEPTERTWLFALEFAAEAPNRSLLTADMQMRTRNPVRERVRYTLESHPDHSLDASSHAEIVNGLQLPPSRHPRALELAGQWRNEGLDGAAIVARALQMFNKQSFYYTLTPPLLLEDSVDQFLFESRQGFCEHYAAAFVVLMRGAGVPARVVTGYQGGAVNPVGNYLVVRQRDAHAWAEVWLEKRGWVRVDPTAAVAPNRIMQGIDETLPESIIDIPLGFQDNAMARNLWQQFSFTWDALNNRWNQWVLGYDKNRQSLFLNRIGLGMLDDPGLIVALTGLLAVILTAVAVWVFRSAGRVTDSAKVLHEQFCRKLARRGLVRSPSEGPVDFAERAQRKLPEHGAAIASVTGLYLSVRYAGNSAELPLLRRAVGAFDPGS